MTNIDHSLSKRLNDAAARYESHAGERHRAERILQGQDWDWRKIETPTRVLRRMQALGLESLAGEIMSGVTAPESIRRPHVQVGLLERILEENDLLSSRFLHLGSQVAESVCKIVIQRSGRILGSGTGFMISPRLLMTNNHVLENKMIARESTLIFDYYQRRSGITGPTLEFKLEPETFFITDQALDYTVVAVAETSPQRVPIASRGYIPLIVESGKVLIGEPVNIIQHPSGGPQQIAIKNNTVVDRVDDYLHYQTDTQPGSSGSPVFNMQWELAALHHSGVPKQNDQGQILLQDGSVWNGTRADLDRIQWIANEGVRISSIVADLQSKLANDQETALFESALISTSAARPVSPPVKVVPSSTGLQGEAVSEEGWSDEQLDRLTPEQVATWIAELESQSLETTLEFNLTEEAIVSEGDSWFDYAPAGLDIISCLKIFHRYPIYNVAEAGDTLDNMAWGTEYKKRNWQRREPPLEETVQAIQQYQPRIVLLSGGGNDVAGQELSALLNHKSSGLPILRKSYIDFLFDEYFKRAYQTIMHRIWEVNADIQIVTHGYGYPIPDGRAVIRILNFSWIGPWLRPPLTEKGYTDRAVQKQIINHLIDRLNEMLQEIANADSRVHHLDLREAINDDDWANELHLKNSAYRRVANQFHDLIRGL